MNIYISLLLGCLCLAPVCLAAKEPISCNTQKCEIQNKALVMKIYTDLMNKNQLDQVSQIFDQNLRIYTEGVEQSPVGEQAHLQALKIETPSYIARVKHITADGDYVAAHWHLSPTANEFSGKVVVDLYKLSGNKILEHWHLSSKLNAKTASGNSVFSDLYQYKRTKPKPTQTTESENKTLATSIYLDLFNNKKIELIDQYFIPDYIQHNPFVPNGREALRSFVSSNNPANLQFFATLAEDDLVWTFSGKGKLTLVDIFRIDNKKIVEHYDIF